MKKSNLILMLEIISSIEIGPITAPDVRLLRLMWKVTAPDVESKFGKLLDLRQDIERELDANGSDSSS